MKIKVTYNDPEGKRRRDILEIGDEHNDDVQICEIVNDWILGMTDPCWERIEEDKK